MHDLQLDFLRCVLLGSAHCFFVNRPHPSLSVVGALPACAQSAPPPSGRPSLRRSSRGPSFNLKAVEWSLQPFFSFQGFSSYVPLDSRSLHTSVRLQADPSREEDRRKPSTDRLPFFLLSSLTEVSICNCVTPTISQHALRRCTSSWKPVGDQVQLPKAERADLGLLIRSHLHYISNPRMDGGELVSQPMDFTRHTIVFFHAGTLSSSSFKAQMQDPRLNANFNLLFMDARFHGGTEGGKRDAHKLEVRETRRLSAIRR